jgi:hypothetical protein
MLHRLQIVPAAVASLIHNLDAALRACEDLLRLSPADTHNVLRCELTVIAHVLQAREGMRELETPDGAVTSQITLFLAVTDCLEDARPASDSAAGPEGGTDRLVAGQIPAATLIALAAAMRDVLELCCAILNEDDDAPVLLPTQISEAMVWATGPD